MQTSGINDAIQALVERGYNDGVAKESPFDPESAGVPPQMFASEVDEEGWVEWHRTPSAVTVEQIQDLFNQYEIDPPQAWVAYLLADCHLVDQVNNGQTLYGLPEIPADNPLRPMWSIFCSASTPCSIALR